MDRVRIPLVFLMVSALTAAACAGGTPAPTATPKASPTPAATIPPPATATATPNSAPAQLTGAELGKSLSPRNGCTACHSIDGSPLVGPTWQGLFGKEELLADGTAVRVDEAYLRESIVDPEAKIVKGFVGGIMPPDFGDKLSAEEIDSIVAYIKTLQ